MNHQKKHQNRTVTAMPVRLPVKIGSLVVLSLVCLLAVLSACRTVPTGTTETSLPTVVTIAPTVSPDPAVTTKPTSQPTSPVQHELLPIEDYGSFSSGHSLLLPDGLWLDTGSAGKISQIRDLVVTSEGQGRPTLSRQTENRPLLTLNGCESITFRQVRFGYDRPDWSDQSATGPIPLLELNDCVSIYFEECEFFGSSGSALLISGSENIILQNCTFYNNAGEPIETGDAWLPSQIRCTDCLFETIGSGYLPLNLRDSKFDRCEWIGRRGYRVPVAAANSREAEEVIRQYGSQTLPGLLTGVLAARVAYHSDANQAIVCQNNNFTSGEVFNLFSQMEQNLPDMLPAGTISWALSGQKDEEAAPGQALDPTLGLRLSIRTQIDEVVAEPQISAAATPGSAEPTETTGPTEPTETAAPAKIYDMDRLLVDLAPLSSLADHLDPLITGNIQVDMSDQFKQKLLTLTVPVDKLDSWIDPADPDRLLTQGNITVYHPDLAPAVFCQRDSAGYFTAGHLDRLLREALCISQSPMILYPETGACFIENKLNYLGTLMTATAALHQYTVQIELTVAQPAGSAPSFLNLNVASIIIHADNAARLLLDPSGQPAVPFQLADTETCDVLMSVLQEPILVDGEGAGQIRLQTLDAFTDDIEVGMPIFVLAQDPERIKVRTVLYDDQCKPNLVDLTLEYTGDQWQLTNQTIPDNP
ncbi:MAG: right-handed parallel beta-helix repeat-containing protein [Bacillota bacterium]|nr:right-handed parallel beta-helix repeat-containing protein [Bacillota bacterium]